MARWRRMAYGVTLPSWALEPPQIRACGSRSAASVRPRLPDGGVRRDFSSLPASSTSKATPLAFDELGALASQLRASAAPPPAAQERPHTPQASLVDSSSLSDFGQLAASLRASDAPAEAVDWMVETLGEIERRKKEQEALMKRSWSDTSFEEGDAGNNVTLQNYEVQLADMMHKAVAGLGDAGVLGSAIDLAGAYKKNYRLDQAEAVLLSCTRESENRSGAWMVKYLNHMSQVRMKQRRNAEAMEMMYEMEQLAHFDKDEAGASEFYETLYRNMASCLRSMGREDEAAVYFAKMVDALRRHKRHMDWMDLWDLGVLVANRAFQAKRWEEFYKSREIIAEALKMQKAAEPHECILRAKILSNLGQCYLATEEYAEADLHYSEAYELFDRTVGRRSPLFGMQAWACGNLRMAEKRYAEAVPFLGEALYVEVVGDGLSVSEMAKLLDQLMVCFHEWLGNAASAATDLAGPLPSDAGHAAEPLRRSLATLIDDPRWDDLPETPELAIMSHKAALMYVAARWNDQAMKRTAALFNRRALDILRRTDAEGEAMRCLVQADAIQRALFEDAKTHAP
eukprot:TRINITY_DN121319_c0_g1_i1.p1 TRINITY_DN121319_c0_g1~~TRINITY_DN121319_c0_g1_i1.p1  ORF type:complete len:570 (+),score=156.50 TRINITY_DN121319_c0_g1_i1:91-1800(+)